MPGDVTPDSGAFMPMRAAFPDPAVAFLPPEFDEPVAVPPDDEEAELQIDPAVLRDRIPGVTAYFRSGTTWYFIDAEGEVQGPFDSEKMVNWFRAGAIDGLA